SSGGIRPPSLPVATRTSPSLRAWRIATLSRFPLKSGTVTTVGRSTSPSGGSGAPCSLVADDRSFGPAALDFVAVGGGGALSAPTARASSFTAPKSPAAPSSRQPTSGSLRCGVRKGGSERERLASRVSIMGILLAASSRRADVEEEQPACPPRSGVDVSHAPPRREEPALRPVPTCQRP